MNNTSILGFFEEYSFLSNFYVSDVWFEGIKYPSSENAYQAAKVAISDRHKLTNCSPGESKKLWKQLNPLYSSKEWDDIKFKVMTRIVTEKFLSNDELLEKLCNTHPLHLEETNWWGDVYWGVCKGKGKNQLGSILMNIRRDYLYHTLDVMSPNELVHDLFVRMDNIEEIEKSKIL